MPDFINQFGGLVGVASLLVSAFIYLYSMGRRGRQDILRQDNVDLMASNTELRAQNSGYRSTIESNAETIRTLREIATQTPAVTKLLDVVSMQQSQTSTQHVQVIEKLTDLTGEISNLAAQFFGVAKAINKRSEEG